MRTGPTDLARSLKKLGLAPEALASPKRAAAAVAGAGDKKIAKLVRELDDASLAVVRRLLDDKPAGQPVKGAGVGGAGVARGAVETKLTSSRPLEAEEARALYKPSMKTPGRPFERFLLHAGRLHGELGGPNAALMLRDPKVAEGVRKHLFMLEGLARFYEERGPSKQMAKALASIKGLEDALGAFGYACDVQTAAKDLALTHEERAHVNDAVDAARSALKDALEDGWLPSASDGRSERLNDIVDTFAKIDFGSDKEDTAFVKKRLAEMCDDIAGKKLDMTDLEGGIHELRRQLRWIPITLIALDGLVALDESAGGPFAKLKEDPVAQTPFARLPKASGVDRKKIEMPWPEFLALSKVIGDLGKVKDRGQMIEGVAAAIGGKHAHERAEQLFGDVGAMKHVEGDAARIADDLTKSGLLPALAKSFRA